MSEWPYGYGFCCCGCGERTAISKFSVARYGYVKGKPVHFRRGHSRRRGSPTPTPEGYLKVWSPPLKKYVFEHVAIAEHALGRPLPRGAEVHHVNGDGRDNRSANLVICQDHSYHLLLHTRTRSLAATGRADLERCQYCSEFDAAENLYIRRRVGRITHAYHRVCHTKYLRRWRAIA